MKARRDELLPSEPSLELIPACQSLISLYDGEYGILENIACARSMDFSVSLSDQLKSRVSLKRACFEPPRITTNHQHQRTTPDRTITPLTDHTLYLGSSHSLRTCRIDGSNRKRISYVTLCPSSYRSPSFSACPVLRAELTSLFVDLQDVAELVSEFKHCDPNTSGWDWRSSQSGDKCCNLLFDHRLPSGNLQWHFNAPPTILDFMCAKEHSSNQDAVFWMRKRWMRGANSLHEALQHHQKLYGDER